MPDGRLVTRVRQGDERAFEAIYDRYHRPLLAFCRHMLGSREEAEDALQHVFVAAHRHLVSRDDVVELRPWLYAIARNRCLSVLRARRESVALDDIPEPSVEGLSVAGEVEQRQDLKEVLGDLARLPDEQRAALVLSELGALSHDEIGAVLGVRREKVKALVFQARESLAGWRLARNTDCRDIREQLANLRGGALRRGPLRKHLETCDGCRVFRTEVRRQREAMALLLPVVPSIALKAKVIGAVAGKAAAGAVPAGVGAGVAGTAGSAGVAGGTAASAGGALSALGGGFAAKALVVAAVAGSAGGGYAVVDATTDSKPAPTTRIVPAAEESPAQTVPAAAAAPTARLTAPERGPRSSPEANPGRGSSVGAEKAKGHGRSDAATPGVPGKPPVAERAPGQVEPKATGPKGGNGRSGARPAPPAGSKAAPKRTAKAKPAPNGPPTTADRRPAGPEKPKPLPQRPATAQTNGSGNAADPAAPPRAERAKPVKDDAAETAGGL